MPSTVDYVDYCREVEEAVKRELMAADAVIVKGVKYVRYVSRSKGRRNGKKILRKNWREVHLVKYGRRFLSWHKFPFDIYATEILGQAFDGEDLKQSIIDLWGY